jgi:hypothetical protein
MSYREVPVSKRDKIYIFIFIAIALLYVAVEMFKPEPTDWSESYSRSDKIPYGTFILSEELSEIFPDRQITNLTLPPFQYLRNSEFDSTRSRNWIFINDEITIDNNELSLLMGAVSRGDNLFISTSNPGAAISDTLGFEVGFRTSFTMIDSLNFQASADSLRFGTTLNFTNPLLNQPDGWEFRERASAYFSDVDTANTIMLGQNQNEDHNFIKVAHGRGDIYVHLFPRAFTNFYLRDDEHARYAFNALSYLPVRNVVWDEYYKSGRSTYTTPLGYVLSEPSLRHAWFVILAGICLFMVFKGRRLQRSIPEKKPPKNSTLEFARTIGSLYFEKGSHKEIALKKIKFFTDYCRRHLNISITEMDAHDKPITVIAERSGVPEPDVSDLMKSIRQVRQSTGISTEELKSITSKIDQFYKNSQR